MYIFYASYVIISDRFQLWGELWKKRKLNFFFNHLKEQQKKKLNLYYFSLKDGSNNRFSKEKLIFTRETEEMLLELDFRNNQESFLYLKKEKLNYNLVLIVKNKIITPTKIQINYLLNEEDFFLKIKIEGE